MRYINLRFTYLLTFLLTYLLTSRTDKRTNRQTDDALWHHRALRSIAR